MDFIKPERMTLRTSMIKRAIGACLLSCLACMAFSVQAQETRVAAVNSDRILRESLPAKAAQAKLEQEFSKRDHDLQDLAQRLKAMSDALDKSGTSLSAVDRTQKQQQIAQMDADFQRKQREFRDDLNERRNEELAAVLDRANKVIKQVAEQNHYDLIVQEAVYVSPRIDITDQVLKALASQTAPPASN